MLLETGSVEADSKDEGGRTPLSYAADHWYEAEAVAKLLPDKNSILPTLRLPTNSDCFVNILSDLSITSGG